MKKIIIILTLFYSFPLFSQNQLNEQSSFYHFLKFSDANIKEYVVDYMNKNFRDVLQKYKNDEFDFENKKEEYLKKLIDNVSSYEPGKQYIIITKAEFGEYNFEGEYFSFHPLTSRTYFSYYRTGYCDVCPYKTRIKLFFNNTEDFYNLELTKEEANSLIKSRKDNYGNISKDVEIKIIYELLNKVDYEKGYNDVGVTLMGNIKSIEIFDKYGYNLNKGTGKIIFKKKSKNLNELPNNKITEEKPINKEIIKLGRYIKTLNLSEELKNKLFEILKKAK